MNKRAHYQTLEEERIDALFRQFAAQSDRPLRVLDFGCGRGRYLRAFAGIGCAVQGVDLNPAYVEEGRAAGFQVDSPQEFFEGDSRDLDIVFLSHLVEHLEPEALVDLIPRLCARLGKGGRLVLVTPLLGERFYHDFSHIRPYYPQSIRHAFGQNASELSFGAAALITLVDIYFFKDPHRTRLWRSFYVGTGAAGAATRALNGLFDLAWRLSGGRIGVKTSWLGVYEVGGPH